MGKYTIVGGKTDDVIDRQLQCVVPFLRKCFPDTGLIVLVGGFGRGEGFVAESDKGLLLHSDFDLYVIRNARRSGDAAFIVKRIAQKLANGREGAALRHTTSITLDLHFLTMKKMRNLPPTIRFFDLLHGSTVLCGVSLPEWISSIISEELPPYEGIRLLINRLYYMCEWFSLDCLRGTSATDKKQQWKMAGEAAKNYLIVCSALLVLAGKYNASAIENARILESDYSRLFPVLHQVEPDLALRTRDFVERRLQGRLERTDAVHWHRSLRDLLTIVHFYAREWVGLENWEEFYAKIVGEHLKPYILRMLARRGYTSPGSAIVEVASVAAQLVRRVRFTARLVKVEKRLYGSALFDYRDPAVVIYDALLGMYRAIGADGTVKRTILDEACRQLRKVYPCGMGIENSDEAFARLMSDCVGAYDINFGKGPTLRRDGVEVIIRAID